MEYIDTMYCCMHTAGRFLPRAMIRQSVWGRLHQDEGKAQCERSVNGKNELDGLGFRSVIP